MLALAARSRSRGKPVGVYIEDKDPAFHESAGLPLEKKLVEALVSAGYKEDAGVAVILQSFEEQVWPACDASAELNHERDTAIHHSREGTRARLGQQRRIR